MSFFTDTVAAIVEGKDAYGHHFGGPVRHEGTTLTNPWEDGTDAHAYLLYNLNLDDPELSISLPGIKWLPFYYPLCLDYEDFAYRIVSDDRIEILVQGDTYPTEPLLLGSRELPRRPVTLRRLSYDEYKTLVYYHRLFETGMRRDGSDVSAQDQAFVQSLRYPFTQFGGIQRVMQEVPHHDCPDGKCDNHYPQVICTVWDRPVAGVRLFADDEDDIENRFAQYVFEFCRRCRTVYVSNQCD